jgi:hypothetical protein
MAAFIGFTFVLLLLHLGGAAGVIKFLPRARNGVAFLAALTSAYVFSIAFDNIWGPLLGAFALSLVPIIAGTLYGFGFYTAARNLVTRPIVARSAYFVIGVFGILAGIVGHKHNVLVGASLVVLSVVLPFHIPAESRRVTVAGD